MIKINSNNLDYFYNLFNTHDKKILKQHLANTLLYSDNRFDRNVMYVFEDFEKFKKQAKDNKINNNELHKIVLDWINIEVDEVLNLRLIEYTDKLNSLNYKR